MKTFSKTIEDFTCLRCGADVRGNGYTNHCPRCLWSRDVDVNPGDRANPCRGMMRPVAAESKGIGYIITHKCEKCGKIRRQRASPDDDVEEIVKLAAGSTG
jgi:DNA-directed RNA polymerase subunit RPC12/RpoP